MEKLKQAIKWIGTDGLLHFLACYAMMMTLVPLTGYTIALIATSVTAIAKEAYDFFIQGEKDMLNARHDLICDAAGLAMAVMVCVLTAM